MIELGSYREVIKIWVLCKKEFDLLLKVKFGLKLYVFVECEEMSIVVEC